MKYIFIPLLFLFFHLSLNGQNNAVEVEEIFIKVEEMPLFGGCETVICSNNKLIQFLSDNINYPKKAKDEAINGQVIIRFVVDTDGNIEGAEVVRDIGGGCGREALRVVNLMNELQKPWKPGKQRGKNVRLLYTLPVNFDL